MITLLRVLAGFVVWFAIAVAVALVVGRAVGGRDRSVSRRPGGADWEENPR